MATPDFDECPICFALIAWGKHKAHVDWHNQRTTRKTEIINSLLAELLKEET